MSDDSDGCLGVLGLIILVAAAIATLVIFHGDVRCLLVDCVIVKEGVQTK